MNDTANTAISGGIMTFMSIIIAHLPEIQATITFLLTVCFFIYKIREARAKAQEAEEHREERHKRYANHN